MRTTRGKWGVGSDGKGSEIKYKDAAIIPLSAMGGFCG